MAKKNRGLSPTFKAGLIVIIVIGLIWAITTMNDPWYENPIEPIAMADETTKPVVEVPVVEPEPESEPTEDLPTPEPEVEPEPEPEVADTPEAQLPDSSIMMDDFDYKKDLTQFANETIAWSFRRNTDHSPVVGYNEGVELDLFDAFYIVPTTEKVMYLTFDEGYENGFTAEILDTLKAQNVLAAFFVTESYIRHNPELTKRMKDEGHIVGNHSVNHYSMPTISYEDAVYEIQGTASSMVEHTGYQLDLFFRPPEGTFSEQSLYITRQQGYKTIFWSMAYQDWNRDNQPGKEAAYKHVTDNAHPGAVILLHAVSESNTQALNDILKDLKAEGYRFGSLYEIASKYTTQ